MPWRMATLSPDGALLLCTRPLQAAPAPGSKRPSAGAEVIHTWDLTTGKERPYIESPGGSLPQVYWTGARRFVGASPSSLYLYDIDSNLPLADYTLPGEGRALAADPSGHVWISAEKSAHSWRRIAVPGTKGDDAALDAGEIVFPHGATIRVEVDLSHRDKSLIVAKRLAGALQARGLTIGPGAWLLRLDYSFTETGRKLSTPKGDGIPIMAMTITWRLIAPDGAEVTKAVTSNPWDPAHSKYTDRQHSSVGPHGSITAVDFGGMDPKMAQNAELREKVPDGVFQLSGVPAGVLKSPRGYVTLPIKAMFEVE
jgi:hypothetical protein